jgi:hypothetical protein
MVHSQSSSNPFMEFANDNQRCRNITTTALAIEAWLCHLAILDYHFRRNIHTERNAPWESEEWWVSSLGVLPNVDDCLRCDGFEVGICRFALVRESGWKQRQTDIAQPTIFSTRGTCTPLAHAPSGRTMHSRARSSELGRCNCFVYSLRVMPEYYA